MTELRWKPTDLPVEHAADPIRSGLSAKGALVLTAEPGAGKSSLVPLIVANHVSGRVVLLQPRRLAARATAHRLASLLGESLGTRVGLTIRGERTVSARCRIEVVTEAVLTNRLLNDAELPGVGAVIFDEFHERSVNADLGLGMALEARTLVRPDLAVVAMSATIDAPPLTVLLDDAPVVEVEGRTFPVETIHHHRPDRRSWAAATADLTRRALAQRDGDALVFVPGRGEVSRVCRELQGCGAEVFGLHGGTPADEQRKILQGDPARRVIVATAIAETSVTVPGVTIVIDGGLARRPRFDPASGLGALETVFVPRFGADQRRGRAGRIEPGVCHRMWSMEDERHLDMAFDPEIATGDPLPLALTLSRWGDPMAADLPLLDHPGEHRLTAGRRSLETLGIVDADGRLTEVGHSAARLPVHPRIGVVLVKARNLETASTMTRRLAAVEEGLRLPEPDLSMWSSKDVRPAEQSARRLIKALGRVPETIAALPEDSTLEDALLLAWPDRVGRRRSGRSGRFLLASGTEVGVDERTPLARAEFIVVATADGAEPNIRVRSAVEVQRAQVTKLLAEHIKVKIVTEWHEQQEQVVALVETRLGAIVLHQDPDPHPDPSLIEAALIKAIRRRGTSQLRWTEAGLSIRDRLRWLHGEAPQNWPDMSEDQLLARLEDWVSIGRAQRPSDVVAGKGLLNLLDWDQRADLDSLAPERLPTPLGRERAVDYSSGRPIWSIRLQHLFGLDSHPVAGPNRTPVTIELLTPADRPAQTTNDLPGFWRGSYAAVRADLRGRYPKHSWPEDPLAQ
ncbi:MAG: ATP-dependent helicase HrpB [Acidimicrobiia bacterium]|nr:ATP-dependent helicase HrpB [Acidimicrobiia bacterium]